MATISGGKGGLEVGNPEHHRVSRRRSFCQRYPQQADAKKQLLDAIAALEPRLVPAALIYLQNQNADADPAACLARAEQVVDLLRTRYVREGWKIDEKGADRALADFQAHTADGSEPDDGWEATMDFPSGHGVSLDWIFRGDIAGLICGVAQYSPRASNIADADLLALAERYIIAERKYGDLSYKVDQMEKTFKGENERSIPAALFWQDSYGELGLPSPHSLHIRAQLGTLEDHPAAFESADIRQLRGGKWVTTTRSQTKEWKLSGENAEPKPAARARADEIIAAYEEWQTTAKKAPRGYKKAVQERDQADRAYQRLEKEIAKTRARTARGMFSKLRSAQHLPGPTRSTRSKVEAAEVMAVSIFNDVKRMSGNRIAAVEPTWLPAFGSPSGATIAASRTDRKAKPQCELYPMPGDYCADCETDREYAVRSSSLATVRSAGA